MTPTNDKTVQQAVEKINRLNLEPMMFKLMHEEGEGWTLEQTKAAEKWYKRFLILNVKYPEISLVPNEIIDEFWHYHILDTEKYAIDCQQIFGKMLHHFPYFGMRSKEDAENLETAFKVTTQLYLQEFGETPMELGIVFNMQNASAKCDGSGTGGNDCGSCGKSCTTAKCDPGRGNGTEVNYSIRPNLSMILN